MEQCNKLRKEHTESLVSVSEDSGLVADAFDVLPDEQTLVIDDDLLGELSWSEDDLQKDFCGNLEDHLDCQKAEVKSLEQNRDYPQTEQTFNNNITRDTGEECNRGLSKESGKLLAYSKEQARQWRRKRLLGSNANQSNSSQEMSIQRGKLKPLLPLPSKLKPLKDKKKGHSDHDKLQKKLEDPLLGGEKIKHQRGPMPMKLRALPESFWKEPTTLKTSSLARSNYTVLPPLFSSEDSSTEDVLNVRPITPPDEKRKSPGHSPRHKKKWVMKGEPNTELLFSLFDHLEDGVDEKLIVRRGRPKKSNIEKTPHPPPASRDGNDDPCIVDNLAEKLFPDLTLSQRAKERVNSSKYAIIKIGKGVSTVEFPAVQLEQNYPALLNELVTHM